MSNLGSINIAAGAACGTGSTGNVDSVTATVPAIVDNSDPDNPVIRVSSLAPPDIGSNEGTAPTGTEVERYGGIPGQKLVARWTVGTATRRFFAVDFVNGNDAHAGYSDVSLAAAGAVAKKTLAGLAAVFPPIGAGRSAEIAIGNGGVNVAQAYTDSLVTLLQNCSGYAVGSPIVRGTGTNTTAGSVAFAGTAADVLYCGGVTGTGMNGAGYNPVAPLTNQTIKCTKAGGAAPAFPAETLTTSPLGWRIRFDSATATVALRNIARGIVKVAGGDTLTTATTLPAVPAAGDVFYIEMPGVSVAAGNLIGTMGNGAAAGTQRGLQIGGIDFGASIFNSVGASLNFCAGAAVGVNNSQIDATPTMIHPVGNTLIGGGLRNTGTLTGSSGAAGSYNLQACVSFGTIQVDRPESFNWTTGSVAVAGMRIEGDFAGSSLGSTLGAATTLIPCRIIGAGTQLGGLLVTGGFFRFGNIEFTNMGAKPGLSIGVGAVCWQAPTTTLSGTTGNTDTGAAFADVGAIYWLQANTNTLSGTAGDLRIKTPAGTVIVTWVQVVATGLVDGQGNRVINTSSATSISKFSGAIVTAAGVATVSYLADTGAQLIAANLAAQRYPTSLRLANRLRVTKLVGAGVVTNNITCTLYKNGVATAMIVTVLAADAQFSKYADLVHPILFADGDDYDLRLDDAGDVLHGILPVSAAVEWAA